jgi:demethylmenaquinone methyltransferase/2-methoxy-6-polyprenyl-1,4-benzoquinol methylase
MFDAIAARYDLLNHLLSAGLDRQWRRRAIATLQLSGRETLLDLCTGTGDLALAATEGGEASHRARRVVGIDFSGEMLRIAQRKAGARPINLLRGDAARIPLAGGSVDAVTIGFGIRNVERPLEACREIARVLKPNGRLVILEFSLPKSTVLRSFYLSYFRRVLPLIGRVISRHTTAYRYLPQSVEAFPSPEDFSRQLRDSGFGTVDAVPLTFGVVYMFVAAKGERPGRVV